MARRLSLYYQKVLSPQALAMVALIAIDNNLCVDIHCHQWIVIHVIDSMNLLMAASMAIHDSHGDL